uniref:ANK_REP_REGION domain-containing protein n=1 Tax=Bursaphelenchus xylophilus TaxID=6326 RepID=A0A1I7SDR0_BURXY
MVTASTPRGAASHYQSSPPYFCARGLFLELILVNKLAANGKTEGSDNGKTARHHHNLQDRQGKTLLIYSCIKGQLNTVEELAADHNIDPNIPDNEGNTALIHASAAGHAKVVQVLVDRFPKIKIDQVNKLGQSALMKSAIQGRTNCAKILLRAGADPYKRDFGRQFCALEWAEYVGRTECAQTIAHFMLEPGHKVPDKKLSTASDNLKQVACLVAIPLIGGDMPVIARPRVRSAPPIPAVKITPSDGKFVLNNHKKAARSVSRPTSSLA